MKKIGILWILYISILCGCTATYQRDTSAGNIRTITLTEMEEKLNKEETFALVFTQEYCMDCIHFKEMLDSYLLNHHVIVYDILLDKEAASPSENVKRIRPHFPKFNSTPDLYYIENGKVKNRYMDSHKEIKETEFDEWIQEYKLDALPT